MIPILAAAAVSTISDIYQKLAAKAPDTSAQSVSQAPAAANFSTILNSSSAANATQAISSTQRLQSAAGLTSQLLNSADVTSAISASGAHGPLQIQLTANGDASLLSSDGKVTPIQLSDSTKGIAEQLYQANAGSQRAGTVVISAA
jgi:hypothetical protein